MDSGNEYVIQVKANQKTLLAVIQRTIKEQRPKDSCEKKEINRGRQECRKVKVYNNKYLYIEKDWRNLNTIIMVINTGKRNGLCYREEHYYISSLQTKSAELFATGIRKHWLIENQLHWVKDVIQNEDRSMIEHKGIATNLSLIKSIAISLFRVNGYSSVKMALEKFRNRLTQCTELMGISPI